MPGVREGEEREEGSPCPQELRAHRCAFPAPLPAAGGSQHQWEAVPVPGAGTAPSLPAQQHPPTAVPGLSAPPAPSWSSGSPPKPPALVCPPVPARPGCWGSGAVPRAGSAHAGDRTGAGSPGWEPALPGTGPFPSTAQPGTGWSQPRCCGTAACWLPETPLSPRPLALPTPPWHRPAFWHGEERREDVHDVRLPRVPRGCDSPTSPQPREPSSAATARLPPSTTR